MRVTQFTQYNNFLLNQQRTLNELNDVQTQISTGVKIQNMYEDPVVYTKYLKLNEEVNSFTQIKSSATFAQTFANETDTVLNDFVSTLGSFKTNLLKAANDTNDETSRNAIVSELEGELEHLKDLANTSIDGKYLFSGSKFNTKPIDDNYEYQGNDAKVKAFLGAGVEREYNIDGASLFLGRDNDYSKHISTNVVQYDKMKANPQFVVRGADGQLYIDKSIKEHGKVPDSADNPVNEPITGDSQIRMLTGVEDVYDPSTDTYSDGVSYFYIKGRKPNGETFSTKISLSNSHSVNDLLEKIGEMYGNSATSKVVDVSLNDMGQIQIKDINTGKLDTDFYMVASDTDEDSIEDLVKNGDYIVEFQKSDFKGIKSLSEISANNDYFDNRIFKFGSKFFLDDNSREALRSDTIDKVFGEGVTEDNRISKPNFILIHGTDTEGGNVSDLFDIYDSNGNPKKMEDLLNEIQTAFGGSDKVDVSFVSGEIVLTDKTIADNESSKISLSLTAYEDTDNDNVLNSLEDKKINIFRSKDIANNNENYFTKNGNILTSNVSQAIKDKTVYYKNGEPVTQINDTQTFASDDTVIMDVIGDESLPKKLNIDFKDINGNYKKSVLELRDSIKTMAATYVSNGKDDEIMFDPSGNSNIENNFYQIMGTSISDGVGNPIKVNYLKISDGNSTVEIPITNNTTFKDIVDNSNGLLTDYKNGKFITDNTDVSITFQHEYAADGNNKILFDTTNNSNNNDKYYDVMGKYMVNDSGDKVEVKYVKIIDGSDSYEVPISDNTTFKDIVDNSGGLLIGYKDGEFITKDSNVKIVIQDENNNPSQPPNNILAGFKSNYQVDLNNDGKISYGEIFNIYDKNNKLTPAHTQITTVSKFDRTTCKLCQEDETVKGVTYKQLGDVVSMLTSNHISPNSNDVYFQNVKLANTEVSTTMDKKGIFTLNDKTLSHTNIELAIYGTSISSSIFQSLNEKVNESGSIQSFSINIDGTTYTMNVDNDETVKTFIDDINNGDLKDFNGKPLNVKAIYKNGAIYLDFTDITGDFEINDENLKTNFKFRNDNSISFQSNNAVTIDEPQVDFFDTLQKAIDAVKNGNNYPDSEKNPRSFGIQGAIEAIDHLTDHVRRNHAKIGAVSNEFGLTIERTDMLTLNVQQLQSDNIDTDLGEATMKLNSLQTSYQALLASIAKVNNLTLLNYL